MAWIARDSSSYDIVATAITGGAATGGNSGKECKDKNDLKAVLC